MLVQIYSSIGLLFVFLVMHGVHCLFSFLAETFLLKVVGILSLSKCTSSIGLQLVSLGKVCIACFIQDEILLPEVVEILSLSKNS